MHYAYNRRTPVESGGNGKRTRRLFAEWAFGVRREAPGRGDSVFKHSEADLPNALPMEMRPRNTPEPLELRMNDLENIRKNSIPDGALFKFKSTHERAGIRDTARKNEDYTSP
ncbi:30S ribosomal protein S21 [Anopheles sinensis]|uniref:30S ribosomal protein S21 n=1 Tax=Anopheles sinensis TaxID=74873 RepID=A0A084W1H9_ANOSI|nr:30S ribosomal protein S21 [Anopheles sinensis]